MVFRIVSFGEALWDLFPEGPVLGGAPLNLAYRVSTLGDRATLVSRVGDDGLGQRALSEMKRLRMDTRGVQVDPQRPTGTVVVRVGESGEPSFTISPSVAYDNIEATAEASALVAEADCLCYGTLAQRSAVSRETLRTLLGGFRGRWRVLDINLRKDCYTPQSIRVSVEKAGLLKMNETEAPVVAAACGVEAASIPGIADALLARGDLELCVVTLGESGCYAAARGGEKVYEPAYEVSLADTVGSGDAFTAAFLHAILGGQSLRSAARAGNALGALVAQQPGGTHPVTRAEMESFAATRAHTAGDHRYDAYR